MIQIQIYGCLANIPLYKLSQNTAVTLCTCSIYSTYHAMRSPMWMLNNQIIVSLAAIKSSWYLSLPGMWYQAGHSLLLSVHSATTNDMVRMGYALHYSW